MTSLAVVLLFLIAIFFLVVQAVASAIVALIDGRWRMAASYLIGVAAGGLIVCCTFVVPVDLRFMLAARLHYEGELARVGESHQQAWVLDAQLFGPNETDLVYDETDGAAPPYGLRTYHEDREGCSLHTERLGGHFYRKSYTC